jgi:hypothetical protein
MQESQGETEEPKEKAQTYNGQQIAFVSHVEVKP